MDLSEFVKRHQNGVLKIKSSKIAGFVSVFPTYVGVSRIFTYDTTQGQFVFPTCVGVSPLLHPPADGEHTSFPHAWECL